MHAERARHDQSQDIRVDWLLVEIERALANRAHRDFTIVVPSNDDHFGGRRYAQDVAECAQSFRGIRGIRGKTKIQGHHRRFEPAQGLQCLLAITRNTDVVIFERPLELLL